MPYDIFWCKFWHRILRSKLCVEYWHRLRQKNDVITPKGILWDWLQVQSKKGLKFLQFKDRFAKANVIKENSIIQLI